MREMEPESKIIESIEILPLDVGSLKASEAPPILNRAASRIDIVKPKTDFWRGMEENLRGAAGWIEAKQKELKGKTLRVIVGASLAATMISACGPVDVGGFIPPEIGPQVTQSVSTEIPLPTESPTEVPTPEATEIPDSVSSREILENSPVKIEFETALVGTVRVSGMEREFNFPDLKTKIIIAVDNSVLGQAQGGIPLQTVELNTEYWDSRYGDGAAQRQIFVDLLYGHYRAWQLGGADEAEKGERQTMKFEDYLKFISEGGDGSHRLMVNARSSSATATESVPIDPLVPTIILFTNQGTYIQSWLGFSYDKNRDTLIYRIRPYLSPSTLSFLSRESEATRDNWKEKEGYDGFAGGMTIWSMSNQTTFMGLMDEDDQRVRDQITYNFQDFGGKAPWHPPFITVYE